MWINTDTKVITYVADAIDSWLSVLYVNTN